MQRRTLHRLASSCLVAVVAALSMPGVAAAQNLGSCNGNEFGFAEHEYFRGGVVRYTNAIAGTSSGNLVTAGYTYPGTNVSTNDTASAFYNCSRYWVKWFENGNLDGKSLCLAPYSEVADLGRVNKSFGQEWEDTMSSWRVLQQQSAAVPPNCSKYCFDGDCQDDAPSAGEISDSCSNPRLRYGYDAYRDAHSGENGAQWTFPPVLTLGVYVIEVFIQDRRVPVGTLCYSGICGEVDGHGDDRGHNRHFNPRETRAFIVIDFVNGKGHLIANESGIDICSGPVRVCQTFTFDAHGISKTWKGSTNAWATMGWVNNNNFRVRYSLRNSVPGSQFAAHTIDHQIIVDRASGDVVFQGDGYPSVGVYQWRGSTNECGWTVTPRRVVEQNDISNLADDPTFSYENGGTHPGQPPACATAGAGLGTPLTGGALVWCAVAVALWRRRRAV